MLNKIDKNDVKVHLECNSKTEFQKIKPNKGKTSVGLGC